MTTQYILIISHPNDEQPNKAVIMEVSIHPTNVDAEAEAITYFKDLGHSPKSFEQLLFFVRMSENYDLVIHQAN